MEARSRSGYPKATTPTSRWYLSQARSRTVSRHRDLLPGAMGADLSSIRQPGLAGRVWLSSRSRGRSLFSVKTRATIKEQASSGSFKPELVAQAVKLPLLACSFDGK